MGAAGSEERLTRSLGMRRLGDMDCRHTGNSWYAPVWSQNRMEVMIVDIDLRKPWAAMQSLDLRLFSVYVGRDVAMSKRVEIDVAQRHWVGGESIAAGATFLNALGPGSPRDSLENRSVML